MGYETMRVRVPDMSCPACFRRVEKAVRRVRGVKDVKVDPKTKEVIVEGNPCMEEVLSAIKTAGYSPEE